MRNQHTHTHTYADTHAHTHTTSSTVIEDGSRDSMCRHPFTCMTSTCVESKAGGPDVCTIAYSFCWCASGID